MAMPEYYLTNCEMDIFQNKTSELAKIILETDQTFDLIELGAGDGTKSAFLLQHLLDQKADFNYMPIDISAHILSVLNNKLKADLPELTITCLEGEYFKMLEKATELSSRRKVVLFLGSNIGNMEKEEALSFCRDLNSYLSSGDIVLMGFDLKKNPQVILDAYNDKTGITAAFNLNLLTRINRELNADFVVEKFEHYQTYDPLSGACRSYLISLENQIVTIDGQSIIFDKDESVYMELSQKYSLSESEELADNSGFETINHIMDSKAWFADVAWLVA
jgi:dimethylhistidine N-methyltransferase